MRFSAIVLAAICLTLAAPASAGEAYSSDELGFSAEFPATPDVGKPQGSETDAKGRYIAQSVIVKAEVVGIYTAMVTVDTYNVAVQVDSNTMLAMSRSFAAQLDASITSSKPGKQDGHSARFFTYKTHNGAEGKGVVVAVPGKKPRTYMAVTMATSLAADAEKLALDTFLVTFHVK